MRRFEFQLWLNYHPRIPKLDKEIYIFALVYQSNSHLPRSWKGHVFNLCIDSNINAIMISTYYIKFEGK